VYQNLYSIVREESRYVVILAGDHVYKMDYQKMLRFHQEKDAAVTLAAIEVPIDDGRRFGVVAVDDADRVTGFLEKPANPPAIAGEPHLALASMGIYVFNSDVLIQALEADAADPASQHDFGKNIIPLLIPHGRMFAYPFYDENKKAAKYWRDIGTLDAYFDANMDLCQVNPEFNLYDPEWPMRTYMPQAPPAKFVFAEDSRRGQAHDSLISPGCIVSGSRITGSILCPNVRVHSFCRIDTSILMPGVRVGRHATIRRAIIDRDVHIPRGAHIGYDLDEDRRRHTVTESGVVVVAAGEEPLIGAIDDNSLRLEAEADRRG
jgi:glucose-1-phosphate adenylyltransferase